MVPAVLALLAFFAGAKGSPYFLDFRYLLDASSLYVETGLLALGLTLVIVAGQIDLSVGSTLALVACTMAKLLAAGQPVLVVVPLGLLLGAVLGGFNGWIITRFKLPSFVVTLSTMAAYRGIAQAMLGAESVKIPTSLSGLDFAHIPRTPIPVPLVIFVVFAVAVGLLLHRTGFGRTVYATGTNERASFYSGVATDRVTVAVFMLSGVLAAVAGMTLSSRLGVARFDHGRGLEVDAITAVVLGGASIAGGSGTILGTGLALLLVALLRTGMGVANVTAEYQLAAIGTLLVVSVMISQATERFWQPRHRAPELKP